ncbi:hypothetical protein ACGFSB_03625 [Streptomyces sp. NPDC048441]|uniref:hypothetical protein n=1 Tax=Streptomyces sp. NPDC048441 TaxID=3365552 RepID=UPI00371FF775
MIASVVGSAVTIATEPYSGPTGVVVGGLAGTAAGKIFEGIIDGFGDDGGKEAKAQVYQNAKLIGNVKDSVLRTSQEAVKAATGSDGAASEAGGDAGEGFSESNSRVDQYHAEERFTS